MSSNNSFGEKIGGLLIMLAILLAVVSWILESIASFLRSTFGSAPDQATILFAVGLAVVVIWAIAASGGSSSSSSEDKK